MHIRRNEGVGQAYDLVDVRRAGNRCLADCLLVYDFNLHGVAEADGYVILPFSVGARVIEDPIEIWMSRLERTTGLSSGWWDAVQQEPHESVPLAVPAVRIAFPWRFSAGEGRRCEYCAFMMGRWWCARTPSYELRKFVRVNHE